jgi:HK97 family phage portal protein
LEIRREQRGYDIRDLARELLGGGAAGADLDPAKVVREAYKTNPTVASAVQRVGTAGSQVPWVPQIMVTGADGEVEPKDLPQDHPVVRLVRRPNPWQTWGWIVDAMLGSLELHGAAYAFLNGPDLGTDARHPGREPTEIMWLPRTQITPNHDERTDVIVSYTYTSGKGAQRVIPAHRMVDPWLWSPESAWKGQGRVQAAAGSIDIANEGRRWNRVLLKNNAQAPGWLTSPGNLSPDAYARLELMLERKLSGAGNARRPGLLEGGLEWKDGATTPVDLDYVNGLRQTGRDIAVALGVDPGMLGDPEVKTYANYSEARVSLYQDTVLPLMEYLTASFELKLTQWWPGVEFFLDTDKVPALLAAKRDTWEGLANLVREGLLTRNEARREMGFDDVDGGDEILVPISIVPLSEVSAGAPGTGDGSEDLTGDELAAAKAVVVVKNGHAKA